MLAGGAPRWHDEVRLRYALAKELEDLGRYAQSWQQLAKGAGLRRAHLQYDVERDVQTVDWIATAFPSTYVAPLPKIRPPSIFIVGLPRSGSTLIERILSCHTEVSAAGVLRTGMAGCLPRIRTQPRCYHDRERNAGTGRAASQVTAAMAALRARAAAADCSAGSRGGHASILSECRGCSRTLLWSTRVSAIRGSLIARCFMQAG